MPAEQERAAVVAKGLTYAQSAAVRGVFAWQSAIDQDEGEAELYRLGIWNPRRPRKDQAMKKTTSDRAVEAMDVLRRDRAKAYCALDAASDLFGIHARDISGPFRFRFCVRPRFAVFAALHACGMSQSRIAKAMNRDRKSIRNGLDRNRDLVERDPFYADNVKRLIETLRKFQEDKTQ